MVTVWCASAALDRSEHVEKFVRPGCIPTLRHYPEPRLSVPLLGRVGRLDQFHPVTWRVRSQTKLLDNLRMECPGEAVMQGDWIIHHHPKDTHLIPHADLIEHQPDSDCICGPTHRSDVSTGVLRWNVWHHSLDGRETDE